MLRSAMVTVFVHETETILRDIMSVHRSGCTFQICNYSNSNRTVSIDQSEPDGSWTALTLYGTVSLPPYGIGVGFFRVTGDPESLRIRLDGRADGDGVFIQLSSPAPRPDWPLLTQ
jgi:hypothetical protein